MGWFRYIKRAWRNHLRKQHFITKYSESICNQGVWILCQAENDPVYNSRFDTKTNFFDIITQQEFVWLWIKYMNKPLDNKAKNLFYEDMREYRRLIEGV